MKYPIANITPSFALSNSNAKIIHKAIDHWTDKGFINETIATTLHSDVEISRVGFDWNSVAKYFLYFSVSCVLMAISNVTEIKFLMRLLSDTPDIIKSSASTAVSLGLCKAAKDRKKSNPEKVYSIQSLFVLGAGFMVVAMNYLQLFLFDTSASLLPKVSRVIINGVVSFVSTAAFGGLGYYLQSNILWFLAILSTASSMRVANDWFRYLHEFQSPHACMAFGLAVISSSILLENRLEWFKHFSQTSLFTGLFYYFIPLWYKTLRGYPFSVAPGILHILYNLSLATSVGSAIVGGLRYRMPMLKGFGYTFLFLQAYTVYLDIFWNVVPRTIFFVGLAAASWGIGSNAETIWNLGEPRNVTKLKEHENAF